MKRKPISYVSEHLNLPQDIISGACIVTSYGNRYVYIENYKGIIEYTNEFIRIQGKNCKVLIKGNALSIRYYGDRDMRVDGKIESVNYTV